MHTTKTCMGLVSLCGLEIFIWAYTLPCRSVKNCQGYRTATRRTFVLAPSVSSPLDEQTVARHIHPSYPWQADKGLFTYRLLDCLNHRSVVSCAFLKGSVEQRQSTGFSNAQHSPPHPIPRALHCKPVFSQTSFWGKVHCGHLRVYFILAEILGELLILNIVVFGLINLHPL